MSNLGDLDSAQSREVEEQLFATHRLQINRHVPVPLPRQDFWAMVHQLLKSLDTEIQGMLMKGMTGMRLQNLQKRQANIRLIASELARKRLVAMMQHVSSQSLRTSTQSGTNQDLPALDWQRHDPAEKAIYHMMQVQIDRFKMEVDWTSMQNGIAGETIQGQTRHAPGTVQLDSFVDSNLTGSAPPDLAFEDREPPLEALQETADDEERFIEEEWPDLDEYIHADLEDIVPKSVEIPAEKTSSPTDQQKHAAALELAPSKKSHSTIEMFDLDEKVEVEMKQESKQLESGELERIRVLMASPEPIATKNGEELTLEEGDIHFVDSETASWLIDSGVAEAAAL
tara:strand:- start:1246 stop:2268 length:1023 start_codon:yes stop_codon:yes gene_type:complete